MIMSQFLFKLEKDVSSVSNVPTHLDSKRKIMMKSKQKKQLFIKHYKWVDWY